MAARAQRGGAGGGRRQDPRHRRQRARRRRPLSPGIRHRQGYLARRARCCRRASTTSASPCSTARSTPSAASSRSVHRDGQNAAYEYDPASDTWRILPLMKAGRGSVGVAALDGKIHAIGGRNAGRPAGRDPRGVRSGDQQLEASSRRCRRRAITRRWWRPTARSTSSAAAPARRPTRPASTTSTIRPDNTWSSGPPLPTPRSGLAGDALQGPDPGARRRAAAQHVRARTKPTIPRPRAGGRWRRCRPDVMAPAPP